MKYRNKRIQYRGRGIQTGDGNSSDPSIPSRTSASNLGRGVLGRRFLLPSITTPMWREDIELGVSPSLRNGV